MAEDRKKGQNNAPKKKKADAAQVVDPAVKKCNAATKQSRSASNKVRKNLTAACQGNPTALGYLAEKAPNLVGKAKEKGQAAIDKRADKKEAAYASSAARERRATKAAVRRAKKAARIAAEEALRAEAEAAKASGKPAEIEAAKITADLSAATEE